VKAYSRGFVDIPLPYLSRKIFLKDSFWRASQMPKSTTDKLGLALRMWHSGKLINPQPFGTA